MKVQNPVSEREHQPFSPPGSAHRLVPCFLHLDNGLSFSGLCPGWQQDQSFEGEVVFSTGMTGYDASLTDPSYSGQILAFTYPLIGNYGVPERALWESSKVHAAGVVICSLCESWSHGNSTQSLAQWLEDQHIPLITGIDTRRLTKVLREAGTMRGAISTDSSAPSFAPPNNEIPLAACVSIKTRKSHEGITSTQKLKKKVVLVDCGMKENILRCLKRYPLTIEQVPYDYDYSEEEYDGLFLSNGPGDPALYIKTIAILRKAMKKQKPIFGICLGTQLLALAAGGKTYKLRYGHRGHNQPCMETASRRCFITSQNHGYAIQEDSLPGGWEISFKNLNDGTVEGIRHSTLPFSAVQFHPEAAPGPTDTDWLFERFFATL